MGELTPEKVEELRRLLEAATPERWGRVGSEVIATVRGRRGVVFASFGSPYPTAQTEANLELAAEARAVLPALLAALSEEGRRAETLEEACREALEALETYNVNPYMGGKYVEGGVEARLQEFIRSRLAPRAAAEGEEG